MTDGTKPSLGSHGTIESKLLELYSQNSKPSTMLLNLVAVGKDSIHLDQQYKIDYYAGPRVFFPRSLKLMFASERSLAWDVFLSTEVR